MSSSTQPWKATLPPSLLTGKQDQEKPLPWWETRQFSAKKAGQVASMSKMDFSPNQFAICGNLWRCVKSNSMWRLASLKSTTSSWETCWIHHQACFNPAGTSRMASLSKILWLSNALDKLISYLCCTRVFAIATKAVMSWTKTHHDPIAFSRSIWYLSRKMRMTDSSTRSMERFHSSIWPVASGLKKQRVKGRRWSRRLVALTKVSSLSVRW